MFLEQYFETVGHHYLQGNKIYLVAANWLSFFFLNNREEERCKKKCKKDPEKIKFKECY